MKARGLGLSVLAVALALLLVAAGSASHVATADQATAAATISAAEIANTTLVRVIHAVSDAPNIDVYLDKSATAVITNLPFENATDGYLPVPAGDHQVTITAAGDPNTVEYDDKLTLPGGTAITLIAEGLLADKSFGIRITVDDVSPTNGKARVKLTHTVSDGPAIDLDSADFKTTLISNLPYGYSQTTTVNPGPYDLVLVPTGKQTPVVIDLAGITLDADQIYSVFVTGLLNGREPLKPMLFINLPIPGFQPLDVATPTLAAAATKVATKAR